MTKDLQQFLSDCVSVVPTQRQLDWFDTEFYAFVHFTVNTYTGLEWGLGDEDPAIFNPTELDCDKWVEAIKLAGLKGMVLTAKHHDGFCLWPSAYTEHSIKNSPYKGGKGDIVREAAEACRRGGIKFGVYLSPWDRHEATYGTDRYNDYYCNQLTELLTNYGELFMVWQDNACGEGPDGKKQVYDFPRINALIRKYQPNAAIFNDCGPDVRWCGNEEGRHRQAEWAVVPMEICPRSEAITPEQLTDADNEGAYNTDESIGTLSSLLGTRGLCFAGAEVDMSIRPGWFYHPEEEPHSLERLFHTYLHTVGGNTCFHLNIPPMPNGLFDPRDIQRLKELGDALQAAFGHEIPCQARLLTETPDGRAIYEITRNEKTPVSYVTILEDLHFGQRIEHFELRTGVGSCFAGTTVGHKRICPVQIDTDKFYLVITGARGPVHLRAVRLY